MNNRGRQTLRQKTSAILRKPRKRLLSIILHRILLLLFVSWAFLPILYIAVGSIRPPAEIWDYPPSLRGPYSTQNYRDLYDDRPEFFAQIQNSVLVTAGAIALSLVMAIPASFAFSRFKFRFLKFPAFFLIAIRMLPPIVITIPLFPIFNRLGLMDRLVTLVLLYSAFFVSLATWIMKTFIDDIPVELEEAASLDGCSRFQAFFRITLPLIRPGIVAVVIFVAIDVWNEYLFAYTFTSTRARTAPTGIAEMLGAIMGVEWGSLLAASMIQLLPVLVFVWIIQKHLVKGMTVGGIKS